jgi:phospho-N-acetylmuramoyl-pentapeptide-transferase
MDITLINAVKVFLPTAVAFFIGIAITPTISNALYANAMWKKKAGKIGLDGKDTPIFNELHKHKEVGTPRMGGTIIWIASLLTILVFWLVSIAVPNETTTKLDFLSRNQTWLPLFTLLAGALVGLVDDYFEVSGRADYLAGGLSLRKRLFIVFLLAAAGGWWFFAKLGISTIHIPFVGPWEIGLFFIPFFIIVTIVTYSGGIIDGIDGLAGGVFSSIFGAYGAIAFAQGQIDLAAFCFVVVGGLLAFLWFNIPPARFYMSETGTMALTTTLAVVAFLTEQVVVLPIIALPLLATTLSTVLQMLSKKYRGRKIFQVAPIHHHFEAIGWPAYKVTMRYWIISIIFAIIGLTVALVG